MSKTRFITILLLIALIVLGWGTYRLKLNMPVDDNVNANYSEAMERGNEYMRRGLYQKAIEEYEKGVQKKNLEKDWQVLLSAYESRLSEDEGIRSDYISTLKRAVRLFKTNELFYTKLTEELIARRDYQTAYYYLDMIQKDNQDNEIFQQLYRTVKYAFSTGSVLYNEVSAPTNGYLTAKRDSGAGLMTEKEQVKVSFNYDYVSSINSDGVYIRSKEGNSEIINLENVIQGKLDFVPEEAGILSEGLIPIKKDGSFGYYNSLGDYLFGEYEKAGSFVDGKSAVYTKGKWRIINTEGQEINNQEYDYVAFNIDGSHLVDTRMVVKLGGKYLICEPDGKEVSAIDSDEVGVLTDDKMFAFRKSEKWGFYDLEGNVIIEPKYEAAKSFSNGFAAVKIGGKWGFIDSSGEMVIEPQFREAGYFTDSGTCMVVAFDEIEGIAELWEMIKLEVS